jgi:hypothetical protein
MAISNHTLGDYITIKTIIENSDISYNKYPKKSKISIKQTTNHQQYYFSVSFLKKLACALFLLIFFSLKKN